ncbi:hypothetical protein TRFO_01007 [Tritrichomonas foetus]|uniref:EF-hand domain-containing protein n=1 Tax=Tritrichomonas foetus TaxID=1144522 RepID=A0A1J4L2G1_9EUKA|nr:hypothetical protein TRFO_01007 [Tritrichomonas foetus]|eukprot:OHT17695.1 hypothetical protein TRFO_01007 [Tritrichomonas foetus]
MEKDDSHKLDYARLIENFRACDTKCIGVLNKTQYKRLAREMKFEKTDDFITITFNALYDEIRGGVPFEMVKLIYEAVFVSSERQLLLFLILFRGIDDDHDGRINEEQFRRICHIQNPDLNEQKMKDLFESCKPDENGTVQYSKVSKKVFKVKMVMKSDPNTSKLYRYSPYGQCCLLI